MEHASSALPCKRSGASPTLAPAAYLAICGTWKRIDADPHKRMTRNEALHPPINAFKTLHRNNLHAQWLQEYFVSEEHLPNFLRFLGAELKANEVRLINATIRPTPKDKISILPYADKDRYAIVICFSQLKTGKKRSNTPNSGSTGSMNI